jgi:hypothetical protein
MRSFWRLIAPLVVLVTASIWHRDFLKPSFPSPGAAQASPSVDLTGKWLFTVTTDAGSGTPTVTLTQKGDSLTGRYSSQVLGEAGLKGSAKDGKFSFTVQANVQGTAVALTYTGTIESKDALKGSVDLGGQASGTFTAKRQ